MRFGPQRIPVVTIPGHALRHAGRPFNAQGAPIFDQSGARAVSGYGHALCECRYMSPSLPSGRQRKAWHRAHKAAVQRDLDRIQREGGPGQRYPYELWREANAHQLAALRDIEAAQ